MALAVRNGAPRGSTPMLCLENGSPPDGVDKCDKQKLIMPPTKDSPSKVPTTVRKGEGYNANNHNTEEITFLIEVVKATIPKRRGTRVDNNRGMHCTAHWVGPTNPSGRKRREKVLHRTKTLKLDNKADADTNTNGVTNDLFVSEDEDGADEVDCTENIFTVNDKSLFLFKTTMKQLVNASINSESSQTTSNDDDVNHLFNNGGLRFDIFEKPLDMFNSVYSTVLADNIAEKEANATTRETSSFTSYRLVGSVFLSPHEILSKCDEQRFECDLMENWKQVHQQHGISAFQRISTKKIDGGRLALRIRLASEFDVAFMKSLAKNKTSSNRANVALQTTLIQSGAGNKNLKPAQLITERDENLLAAETSVKAIVSLSPIAQESMRYLFSNDTEKRIFVKPFADPARPEETTWFTEEGLHQECYKPSTNWIQAGQAGSGSLGKVYLEVLECRGLPNTDAGGSIGNKTDAFISLVYGDIMVQTEVIDDSCSPMWMPWSSRAFVFQMSHPSTAIYIGVADYDVGPLEHECIGRVAIDMGKFFPGTLYTLTFKLFESSNLTEKGEDSGTITVRLRIEIPNEKKYLMEGWNAPSKAWVNSQQWKSHRVAKYCVDGPHDEEVFEMRLFRSHINELLTQKTYLSYAISDAVRSLVFWRGQVKVGNVWLPLHSAIVFYFSIHLVEKPQLFPSFFLFGCGWIMIANMLQNTSTSQPNPWHRGHSFAHHWNVLTHGKSFHAAGKVIHPNQGHKEASKLESKWKQRLADADAEYAKQAELDAKIKTISDETIIRTKAKANGALVDPISAVAGAHLLPYQQRLSGYCNTVRYIRNVINWNESITAFFITLILFGSGCVALFIPWHFLFQWASRLLVWGGLGPWMRILDLFFHVETERQTTKASNKAMKLFHEQHKMAKILREHAHKMKAFRVKLFGQFITRLPEFNLTRHEDVPLPESSAEPYHSEEEIKTVKFVPSQDLSGAMIPMTGQDAVENALRKQKEKDCLIGQYQEMTTEKPQLASASASEDESHEGFELVSTEDRVICLRSELSEGAINTEENMNSEITHARSNSIQDATISDKAIQCALEKELQEYKKMKAPKTKWTFSAKVSLSLRQETVQDTAPTTPTICNGTSKGLIEDMDTVQEEGVEIVPYLGSDHSPAESDTSLKLEDSDHVSVFYVKDDTKQTTNYSNEAKNGERKIRDDNNVTANAVKRIRFKKKISEID